MKDFYLCTPWNGQSSCDSNFLTYRKMSSLPTNFMFSKPLMVMCTFASERAGMASHSRNHFPETTGKTSQCTGVPSKNNHTWSLVTQLVTHLLHPICR
ncbi:hypothetical protein ACHAW6_003453 [Cyclotella cf. meneghiniana]